MKKLGTLLSICGSIISTVTVEGSTYYSQGDLDATLTSSWNTVRIGGGSSPANFTSGDVFIIQNTHDLTTGSAWAVSGSGSKLWIENGGSLTATNAITLGASATFQIDDGGTYIHDNATAYGGSIFQGTESFGTSSTVELRNSNATGPSNITFGNLTVNLLNVANNVNLNGAISLINGNLSIQSTNGFEFRLSTNTTYALTINGDLIISGGTLNASNGSTAGRTFAINVGGNYNQGGGTFTHSNATSGCQLSFAFTGINKSYTKTAGTLTATNINWAINNGASITFNNDFLLAASRSFTMNATSSLILAAGTSFTIAGAADFNHQRVTLRSAISGTARIAQITGTLNNATNVTAERFIGTVTPKRAWRLLSSCISGTTINAAWQEGVTSGNPNPGYGTHITGGTVLNGFDGTGNASVKTYNGTAWVTNNLTATNSGDITAHQGYMLFVRGDRSVDLSQGANALPTNTTLRSTGTLRQGTLSNFVSVTATGYTLMGNPYPSAIDFEAIHTDHIALSNFYTWDPGQAGNHGVGGYNFVERTGAGTYDVTPHGGSASGNNNARYIPPGAAILIQGPGSVVAVSLNESYKVSNTPSLNYFKHSNTGRDMAVNLNNASAGVIDGVRVRYDHSFSNLVNQEDALKLNNNNENIAIERNGQRLVVEKRSAISQNDTVFLRLSGMKTASYQLHFFPGNFDGIAASLEDTYLDTILIINPGTQTLIPFTTDTNATSAGNRFRLILSPAVALPLVFISFTAVAENGFNKIDWEVNNAGQGKCFSIERSADGKEFISIGSINPSFTNTFNWIDASPLLPVNYYRIKLIHADGSELISKVIRLTSLLNDPAIQVYPNPLKGNVFWLRIKNLPKGDYTLKLLDQTGKGLLNRKIKHPGSNNTLRIQLPGLSKGMYYVELTGLNKRITRQLTLQ